MSLPQKLPLPLMQTQWAQQIDPVLTNILVSGQYLPEVQLINGVTVVNHKLSRKMQGFLICGQNAAANIYYSQPFNDINLTLTSNAVVTVNLWVF